MNRRDLIKGGLAASAILAAPARALADPLTDSFDQLLGVPQPAPNLVPVVPAPIQPPPDVPMTAEYSARVVEIAQREVSRAGSRLWRRDIAGIADFNRPSYAPRFHFVNLEGGTIRSFLVTHGKGSDPEHDGWLKYFSNTPGSEATSRGAYLTAEWYSGKYGTSVRLVGMDQDNSTALERAIVMHRASYATADHIARYGKLGRSEGCFAMAPDDFNEALLNLSGGRLLYADRIVV